MTSSTSNKRPPFWRSAAAYLRSDRVFVSPYARTRDGLRTLMDLVHVADHADSLGIGSAVLKALDDCIDNIPDSRLAAKVPSLFKATKLRSWSQLNSQTLSVSISQRPDDTCLIEITPMKRVGSGSEHIKELTIQAGQGPEQIGEAMRSALELSRKANLES